MMTLVQNKLVERHHQQAGKIIEKSIDLLMWNKLAISPIFHIFYTLVKKARSKISWLKKRNLNKTQKAHYLKKVGALKKAERRERRSFSIFAISNNVTSSTNSPKLPALFNGESASSALKLGQSANRAPKK